MQLFLSVKANKLVIVKNISIFRPLLHKHELELRKNIPLNLVVCSDVADSCEIPPRLGGRVIRVFWKKGNETGGLLASVAVTLLRPEEARISALEVSDVCKVEELFQVIRLLRC